MKCLFVDTAGWVGCADASDPAHRQTVDARDRWLSESGMLVTTDYIVDETLTLLRARIGLDAAEDWWQQVDGSSNLRWEYVTLARSDKARAMFFRHRDKDYSFTDCSSFVVMHELKLREALTTDRHFAQAGFAVLPKFL